jgi:hypothetical protein
MITVTLPPLLSIIAVVAGTLVVIWLVLALMGSLGALFMDVEAGQWLIWARWPAALIWGGLVCYWLVSLT